MASVWADVFQKPPHRQAANRYRLQPAVHPYSSFVHSPVLTRSERTLPERSAPAHYFASTDIEYKLDGYETRLNTLDKEFNIVLYNGLKKADFKKLINTTELLALRSKKNEK